MREIIILTIYSIWIVLTCLNQFGFKGLSKLFGYIDIFRLLPVWTFFAPNPGVSDFHLLFRTRLMNGEVTPFITIDLTSQKTLLNALWSPRKRSQKALADFVQAITRSISMGDIDETNQHLLKVSFGYIVILNYCTNLIKQNTNSFTNEVEGVQFTILESFGHFEEKEPRLILNSEFHPL